jgi:predicted O-linked N-acetylglucosamine transferase (SPINDLY family)
MRVEPATTPPFVRNGFVTLGSFNHMMKLSGTTLELWKRIVRALPEARFVALGVPQGPAEERLRAQLASAGVSAARLSFVPPAPLEQYFRWFDAVDLALDPTPYSGGTTTCDTLWMGVPVVTLAGSRSASRSAASILSAVGLDEWIARSGDEYVRLALELARDRAKLAELRASLRMRMAASPVMDEARFVRALEEAYRQMWRRWCGAP